MMGKFRTAMFGAPGKVNGVSTAMDASISRLGKVVQLSAAFPAGFTRPAENYANQRPRLPYYPNIPRVPGGSGYDSSGINPGGGPLPVPNFFNPFV